MTALAELVAKWEAGTLTGREQQKLVAYSEAVQL